MQSPAPFQLKRTGLILALVSAAFTGEAAAVAGRTDFVIGGVTVAGKDGRERLLTRGAELDNGDLVRTNDGRAQIRFTDGAYVSLQPNTEFGVTDYRYEGRTDGNERGFFGLLKGAMRTVTGAIGRINRSAYRITTPTATVGIRGTGGVIEVLPDGSTLVIGTSGIWSLTNPAGSVDVPAGTSAVSPTDPSAPPQQTSEQPRAGPTPLVVTQEFTLGDQPVLPSGFGYSANLAIGNGVSANLEPVLSGGAVFDFMGRLTSLDLGLTQYSLADGSHAEFGTDGILAWGRWTGAFDITSTTVQPSLHYVVGLPTPTMPTIGTATYSLLGATSPTYADGTASPGVFSGSLSVNFGQGTVGMNLNIGIDGKGYAIGGSADFSRIDSTFSGRTSTGNQPLTISGTGGACGSGCSASVEGFLAGANAERAGLGYLVEDLGTLKDIVGTAAFKKN
jgi:hypothetical protein